MASRTMTIDQVLDLSEAVRQYALLALPMKPLCQEDCAGLCPQCGANLNGGSCSCGRDCISSPWAQLKSLARGEGDRERV